MKKRTYHLIIGGNLGDRVARLAQARTLLAEKAGEIVNVSAIYETEPWGYTEQPLFLNQAIEMHSSKTPLIFLETIKDIEKEVGRTKAEKWHARTMDIDILLCGDEIVKQDRLEVPHPLLHERNFVLIPLMEIAADLIHPILKKSIEDIYTESRDKAEVYIFNQDEQENTV
jgi:2-amino-4-hydroxy-6-hydroxymethyldihydropteridine diphosphokinase